MLFIFNKCYSSLKKLGIISEKKKKNVQETDQIHQIFDRWEKVL